MEPASRESYFREFTRDRTYYLGYLLVLTRDNHLAEDLLQEAFLVVFRNLDQFDPASGADSDASFAAWVRGICRKLAMAALRKSGREGPRAYPELAEVFDQALSGGDPAELAVRSEQLVGLRRCLDQLGASVRRLLALRYERGQSLKEIGRQAEKSPKAVQMVLSRARGILASCMKQTEMAGE